jgi:hypothetical protein
MALDMAKAVQTPLAPPDMSSPSSSFANLSFINSTSAVTTVDKQKTLGKMRYSNKHELNKFPPPY